MAQKQSPDAEKRHPIQVVARRTGVNVELLRAWERRYQVVTPSRHEGGKRLYSDADIERLSLLRRVIERGLRIKAASAKTNEELGVFVREHESAVDSVRVPVAPSGTAEVMCQCQGAIVDCDGERLASLLEGARVDLSLPAWIDDLLGPLITWVGQSWGEGELRIYQEHIASSVLRNCIWERISASRGDVATIVATTLSGESHELGALLAAVAATAAGWRVEFLGADLPAEEVAAAVKRFQARAVALSIVLPDREGRVAEEIRLLRRLVGPDVAIFAGGQGVSALAPILAELDVRDLGRPSLLAGALSALPL